MRACLCMWVSILLLSGSLLFSPCLSCYACLSAYLSVFSACLFVIPSASPFLHLSVNLCACTSSYIAVCLSHLYPYLSVSVYLYACMYAY